MFLFMMWMTGSSLSIYTIMFTVQMVSGPFRAIFNVNQSFEQFEHKGLSLMLPKLLFIACNCASVCLALYKFSNMGIIPVLPADWAGLFHDKVTIEVSQVIMPPGL
jgi:ER membrane protein complex subunit 4